MNPATQLLIAKLRELAASGVGLDAAAVEIGASRPYLVSFAGRHHIKFSRPERSQHEPPVAKERPTAERNLRIAELFKQGNTLEEIGVEYAITRERVRQILWAEHGLKGCDGGYTLTVALARAARLNKIEARFQRKHGCSRAQYREMLKAGATRGFIELRRNARKFGYAVEMTTWQWWCAWQESGHWNDRGRGNGYWLFRPKSDAPLSLENYCIAPGNEAMSLMRQIEPSRFPGRPSLCEEAAA